MADVWDFDNIEQDETVYVDGTRVPHLDADIVLNGKKVGRVNIHLHKHRGRDGITDLSFGFTGVAYGPLNEA